VEGGPRKKQLTSTLDADKDVGRVDVELVKDGSDAHGGTGEGDSIVSQAEVFSRI
jgi:hypothetical protein